MINHIAIFEKTMITETYLADTEVTAVYYTKETFLNILNQFPGIKENMIEILADKYGLIINDEFQRDQIHNYDTKNIIINWYNQIVKDDKKQLVNPSQSIGIKIKSGLTPWGGAKFIANVLKGQKTPKTKAGENQSPANQGYDMDSINFNQSIKGVTPKGNTSSNTDLKGEPTMGESNESDPTAAAQDPVIKTRA